MSVEGWQYALARAQQIAPPDRLRRWLSFTVMSLINPTTLQRFRCARYVFAVVTVEESADGSNVVLQLGEQEQAVDERESNCCKVQLNSIKFILLLPLPTALIEFTGQVTTALSTNRKRRK